MISKTLTMWFLALLIAFATALPAPAATDTTNTHPTTFPGHKKTTFIAATAVPTRTVAALMASTSTSSSPLISKTAVSDCNYQGQPYSPIFGYAMNTFNTTDPLECQRICHFVPEFNPDGSDTPETCLSYSFWFGVNSSSNCQLYTVPFNSDGPNGLPLTIHDFVQGLYFSNRYPADGSGFCYSEDGQS